MQRIFAKAMTVFVGSTALGVASAADITCGGQVAMLMADYPTCGGHLAFKTTDTGGTAGIWMCAKSKEASSMILAAQFAGKPVTVYIEGSDVSGCTSLPNFRQISYVITYP